MRISLYLVVILFALPLLAKTPPKTDCLVILRSPNSNFTTTSQAHHGQVIAHSGSNLNWWIKTEDCSTLRDIPEVDSATTAAIVIVSLNPGATLPTADIEKLGGIVYHDFASISAASIVLPSEKIAALAALPGIKKVREDRPVSPAPQHAQHRKVGNYYFSSL